MDEKELNKVDNPESLEHFKEDDGKGPFRIILGLVLILMIIGMGVPYYGIKHNPEPKTIIDVEISNDESAGVLPDIDSIYPYNVSKSIKETSNRIVSEACESGIKICQIKAIYYFVRDKIDYVSDPKYREYVQTPEATLYSKAGDCEDKSVLLVQMLKAIGIDSVVATIPGHAYNKIYYPDSPKQYLDNAGWISVDATCKNCAFSELPKTY